jgi:hypothetical protein
MECALEAFMIQIGEVIWTLEVQLLGLHFFWPIQ